MIHKRLFVILPALAVLAACSQDASEGEAAASGEVLEGTISDAMLPLDQVRSEAPLEDPEAFAAAQRATPGGTATVATPDEPEGEEADADPESDTVEIDATPAAELTPQPADTRAN